MDTQTKQKHRVATLAIILYLNSAEDSQDIVMRSISGENSIGWTKYGTDMIKMDIQTT